MIVRTDENGFIRTIENNDGGNIEGVTKIKIEASGEDPRPKVEIVVALNTADLEINIDNVTIKADLNASFYAMSEEERRRFVDIVRKSGLIE